MSAIEKVGGTSNDGGRKRRTWRWLDTDMTRMSKSSRSPREARDRGVAPAAAAL